MKIVITTKDSLRHQIFLSLCFKAFGEAIVGVFIQGEKTLASPKSNIHSHMKRLLKKVIGQDKSLDDYLAANFADINPESWQETNVSVKYTDEINSETTRDQLQELSPDLVLVFGGTILEDEWVSLPKFGSINLHTGFLPFYRGSHSTEFALYQENHKKIGYSIHYIDKGIDTGPVIKAEKVSPKGKNNLNHLKAEIFTAGIKDLIKIASQVIQTKEKVPASTEHAKDSLFENSTYTPFIGEVAEFRLKMLNKYPWPHNIQRPPVKKLSAKFAGNGLKNGIYILNYHHISDDEPTTKWEKVFTRASTSKTNFGYQLKYLSENAEAVRLSEVPDLLKRGPVDKPYFVITFDDGYTNQLTNALPLCQKYGITPALFICGSYAEQKIVNFRILLSLLLMGKQEESLFSSFNQVFNTKLPADTDFMVFTKNNYSYRKTEEAVNMSWQEAHGTELPKIHLNWPEIKELAGAGWEFGNHTYTHPILAKLSFDDQKKEIESNNAVMAKEGIKHIKWLTYPYGQVKDVNPDTYKWMQENPEWHGLFAKGGVNTFYTRTEWMRVGIADLDLEEFRKRLEWGSSKVLKF